MLAYVGCYTSEKRKASGDGINIYEVGEDGGNWRHLDRVGGLVNPSYLILNKAGDRLYVGHGDETYASSYRRDPKTGALSFLNKQEVSGRNPNHVTLDPAEKFLIVSNYGTGTIGVLSVGVDGSIGSLVHLEELPGEPGPHRKQQPHSRPHHIQFDPSGRFIVVADKGLDKTFVFGFDSATGKITPAATPFVEARAVAGPRRLIFHPTLPVAYGLNELDFTVATFAWDPAAGTLSPTETQTTIQTSHTGRNSAAEIVIAPSGKHLYISNRGHNSVATFAIDIKGDIKPIDFVDTQGKRPRFMTLDPSARHLYVANQDSHSVVHFKLGADGLPQAPGEVIPNNSPTCIAFAD